MELERKRMSLLRRPLAVVCLKDPLWSRMRRVDVRRGLVWVVLLYVTLDLASPHIPGAFVFDAAKSVETITDKGDRLIVHDIALPVMPRDRLVVPEPQNDVSNHVLLPPGGTHHSVVSCLPRAHCAPVRPSEDPH